MVFHYKGTMLIQVILFNGDQSIMETLISNEVSNNLTGLFESGLIFINVETKSCPLGEI